MSNEIVIEAWNTVLFDKFTRFKYLFVEGYASISEEALKRTSYPEGSKVLDVGCGFGDCTINIAKAIGAGGRATGVDCASNFIRECNKSSAEEDVKNADFMIADVEADDLGGPYDEAFARFGTMFLTYPGLPLRIYVNHWNQAVSSPRLYGAKEKITLGFTRLNFVCEKSFQSFLMMIPKRSIVDLVPFPWRDQIW